MRPANRKPTLAVLALVLLAPLASAQGGALAPEGDPPAWTEAIGVTLVYQAEFYDANGEFLGSHDETWQVTGVEGRRVTFVHETTNPDREDENGEYVVDAKTREILSAPQRDFEGLSFWLWIPEVTVGDVVRLWAMEYEVVPSDEEGLVLLRVVEDGGTSEIYYNADERLYALEIMTFADGNTLLVGIEDVRVGSLGGGGLVKILLETGFTLVAFTIFFVMYRVMMKRKKAPVSAAPAAAAAFCSGCGTPHTGGVFCGGCGAQTGGAAA